jgi:hypothetical protein
VIWYWAIVAPTFIVAYGLLLWFAYRIGRDRR